MSARLRKIRAALAYREYLRSPRARLLVCLFAAAVVTLQYASYLSDPSQLDRSQYSIRKTAGLKNPWVYAYGLYYWRLFPVYSTYVLENEHPGAYRRAVADRILTDQGETLRMEFEHEVRFGEYFKF